MELVQVRAASGQTRSSKRNRDGAQLERLLTKKVGKAIGDYGLIEAGDRVMVCVSGGKDSYALLTVLQKLRERAPISFDLVAVNIDQGWPGYRTDIIEDHLRATGVDYRMVVEDTASIVEERLKPGQTPCSLCSRFRRGVLYNLAEEMGCNRIALGHHRDDAIETLLLNLFFAGRLSAMPAKLIADDGRNCVIRPMITVAEDILLEYQQVADFPVVRCGCPSCGLPEQQRQRIKSLLAELEAASPGLKNHMLAALGNVSLSHLLDRRYLDSDGVTSLDGRPIAVE